MAFADGTRYTRVRLFRRGPKHDPQVWERLALISYKSGSLIIGGRFFVGVILAIIAIVTGHIARRRIRHNGKLGAEHAFWGLVFGYGYFALWPALVLLALLLNPHLLLFVFVACLLVMGLAMCAIKVNLSLSRMEEESYSPPASAGSVNAP